MPAEPPKNIVINLDSIMVPPNVPKQPDIKDEAERASLELERKKHEIDALNTCLAGFAPGYSGTKEICQVFVFSCMCMARRSCAYFGPPGPLNQRAAVFSERYGAPRLHGNDDPECHRDFYRSHEVSICKQQRGYA